MAERKDWMARWLSNNMPSREQMAESRWIKPFGQRVLHSEFWRFTRRSVPRGVAVGLFVGVFALIPGVQIVGAALMSIPFRGNIPIAAAMTFLTNPLTTPFLILAAIPVGNLFGFHADTGAIMAMYTRSAPVADWLAWLATDAAPALVIGLFIIAVASAFVGWAITIVFWRWWIGRKWRRRVRDARAD
jgi:uncharacterized protein (DUF2062 family)